MEWYKGIISKVNVLRPKPDEKKSVEITYYHGNENGYSENNVRVSIMKDGAISFSDDDIESRGVYFYPEQARHLRQTLKAGK